MLVNRVINIRNCECRARREIRVGMKLKRKSDIRILFERVDLRGIIQIKNPIKVSS